MAERSRPSKAPATIRIVLRAILYRLSTIGRRHPPKNPKRILIAHQLRIGDTVMLTPLLAKTRARYPAAEIVLITSEAMAPLYQKRPYGVIALPFNSRDLAKLPSLMQQAGFDLALAPGDNQTWLAAALKSRWIVGHNGERPAYMSWMADDLIDYPSAPMALGEIFAELVDGPAPPAYETADWPTPDSVPFEMPRLPYALLHVGSSGPLKRWEIEKWRALAEWLSAREIEVVWSAGGGETDLIAEIDPERRFASVAGQIDLPQLWRLLAGAVLLVCPDTGVGHLARLTGTPTVVLFGPGTPLLFGAGRFWRNSPYIPVTIEEFPCRDQHSVFRREVRWAKCCIRGPSECASPRCMQAIDVRDVIEAAEPLLTVRVAKAEA